MKKPMSKVHEEVVDLDTLRKKIDVLDSRLLEILSERMKVVELVGRYKAARGIPPLDASRWQQVLESRGKKGESLGLPSTFVIKLYELIHELALDIEAQ